jgi:hypothetical protein
MVHHFTELKSWPTVYPTITRIAASGDIERKVVRRFSKSTERNTITTMSRLRRNLIRLFAFMGVLVETG